MTKVVILLLATLLMSGCAQIPACALAKPEDGWHFVEKAPMELKHLQWPETSDNIEMVWVQNAMGVYGQCSKRKNENYCFGLFEIYLEDPPILIMSEDNCKS